MTQMGVTNRQRKVPVATRELQSFAEQALAHCLLLQQRETAVLRQLAQVAVVVVSDRTISRLHEKFMGISGPTDVITFEHGEIVISAETAARQAAEWGTSLGRELRLYIVHGLLHLSGYDDRSPAAAREMERTQERVLCALQRL